MTLSNAIFGSALVIAMAIVFAAVNPADSQQRRPDGYMIASSGASSSYVWRVNTTTGAVSFCVRTTDSTDPGYIARQAPNCSGSSAPVGSGR